ncbi:MAG: GatB/YqeY domain-containing protein [Patescibacteria group bacterium]
MLNTIKKDLITALKNKDTLRVSVIRFLLSKVQNMEIELKTSGEIFTDDHMLRILKKQIKMRKEAIDALTKAGRTEDIIKEEAEIAILQEYYKEE